MSESGAPTDTRKKGPARTPAKKKRFKGVSYQEFTGDTEPLGISTPSSRRRSTTLGDEVLSGLCGEQVLPRLELVNNGVAEGESSTRQEGETSMNNRDSALHQEGSVAAGHEARFEQRMRVSVVNDHQENPAAHPLLTRPRQARSSDESETVSQTSPVKRSNAYDEDFARKAKNERGSLRLQIGHESQSHISTTSDIQRRDSPPIDTGAIRLIESVPEVQTISLRQHFSLRSSTKDTPASGSSPSSRYHYPTATNTPESSDNSGSQFAKLQNTLGGPSTQSPRSLQATVNAGNLEYSTYSPQSHEPLPGFYFTRDPFADTGHRALPMPPSTHTEADTHLSHRQQLVLDHGRDVPTHSRQASKAEASVHLPHYGFSSRHPLGTAQTGLASHLHGLNHIAGPTVPMVMSHHLPPLGVVLPPGLPDYFETRQGAHESHVLSHNLGVPRRIAIHAHPTHPSADEYAVDLGVADDLPPENLRPTPQNLRYGAYQTQQPPQPRNTALGSGRLQNASKSGSAPSWGFGAPNGVSALPSSQPRPTATGGTSFAQTIGGPPAAASLDLSEFPSLSGNSQPQYQNQSQAIWANQRAVQQTPVQRPQQQQSMSSQAPQQHQQSQQGPDQSQRTSEDIFSPSSHLSNAVDEHRFGGTGTLGQLPASRQPQTTSVDDFPPLGRNGTDENDDRRNMMMQNSGFGGFSNANAFSLPPDQAQARNALPNVSSSQTNNTRSSSAVDRLASPNGIGFGASSSGRSPIEPIRQGTVGIQDQDRNTGSAANGNQRHENTMNSLLNNFSDMQFQQQRQTSQSQQVDYGSRTGDAPGPAVSPDQSTPSQMSAMEEFGLAGFLSTARSENPDVSGLARGQDLTSLGLNLNSPEPLYPTFAGPFADIGSRPMQPDYKLPECYTVDNVHRVTDKVPSFHDETLFFIFYTQTQDILQELAASELTNRNWRYHKELRMWLTKEPSMGEPIQISPEKEQGSYSFWNPQTWEKMRVTNFELSYQALAPSVPRPTL